jgi:large subunit ribosomal protein L31
MKKEIHPKEYRYVVFEDLNNKEQILTRSTISTDETTTWTDGNTYPLVKVHISSSSHPFFTGQEKLVDIEGRVDKFKARQLAAVAAKQAKDARTAKPAAKAAKEEAPEKMGRLKTTK